MSTIDLDTLLKLVWSLGSGEAGDRAGIAPDREEKDTLIRHAQGCLEERGESAYRACPNTRCADEEP